MSTVPTKHRPMPKGDPSMSTKGKAGSLLDDMEIIRKLCLPEKVAPGQRNASHLQLSEGPTEPLQTTQQADFLHGAGDVEPKAVRDARAQYMKSKHFDLGADTTPIQSESRGVYAAPPRDHLMNRKLHAIGGPNSKTASSIFVSDQDRDAWAADIETSNRKDFLNPGAAVADPLNKEIVRNHRSNHFDLGTDPADYVSTTQKAFPVSTAPPVKMAPMKARPSAVQLGEKDYDWGKNLQSTNRDVFAAPAAAEQDSLTEFVKQQAPLRLGDDKREYMTENRAAYKKTGFLDCSQLTDEQLRMLGVTREQIIPRKVPLPYLSSLAASGQI